MTRRTRRVGRYHLTDRIALGGMAELYRGFTFEPGGHRRQVAVKRLLPEHLEDPMFLTMLTDEFKLVSLLSHPNIAEVYELVRVDDDLLIAMEFVDGKDLRSTLEAARRHEARLELDDIAYVMARALDGLHHAHVARDIEGRPLRIVHRDFTPSNLLLAYDGTVKLCDFGIAKAAPTRVRTQAGVIKGKVRYMSPEQAFGRRLDWRSDLFSAGSVLYELATGQPAFDAPNEVELIYAVREATVTPCRVVAPDIPDHLARIIEKAMSRSRSARYQTALELRDALLAFLRRLNPRYRRSKLARLMKRVWRRQIEQELRAQEAIVLTPPPPGPRPDLGTNLLADALGPSATYTGFQPDPDPIHSHETQVLRDPGRRT